jgi:hypothetical protein
MVVKAGLWISLSLAIIAAGCGSDESTSADYARPAPTAAATETAPGSVGEGAIVGRWERVHACSELLNAFEEAGLRKLAPALIAEEYYPDTSAAELARKNDPCEGAKAPFVHSHFFDASGRFGSLDENENQVDEGQYEIIDSQTIRIGGEQGVKFNYDIEGDTLMLSPVVTGPMVAEALANPLQVTDAGRAIAVAYPGQTWNRVSCKAWC